MKKSTEVSSGPPAVRRLFTTRSNLDESGKIRKWIFGQQNVNMQNKTILLVGETGTGKTTLINTMVNYYLGVKFEDNVWFEITEEETRDQTESQTSEITVYEIFSEQKPESLTIIDTPGIDKDMKIPQNLYKLFLHETGVKSLDAVCLVLKSSQNRISERLRYIFDAILALFGKDLERNVVLFITHTDRFTVDVLEAVEKEKILCCHDAENEPVHFLFNNIQSVMQTAKTKRTIKSAWEMGQSSMKRFLDFLKSRQRKGLTMSVSVLKERMQLEDCIQNLKEQIEFMEETEKELSEMQNLLKLKKEKVEKDNDFHFTVNIVYTEKPAFNTQLCYVMNDENCTVCKCHSTKHVKEARKHVTKQEEEPEDEKLEKKEELTDVEISLKTLLTKNEKKKNILLKDASELIMKLSKTPDSPLTLCYLDFLIPRVEEAGEEEWAQKLKDLQKRKISSFNNESSAINDLMQKSTELSSGPPAVRRLLTTRSNLDESGKIRKWTFGQKYANMKNKTILLVGETGTGKTTLINTMANYYLGVKFEDKVWFEITEEEKCQTESQTSEITVYEIFSEQKSFSLSIIDTPGYGDTRGIEKDVEILLNLCNLFLHETGVKSLDAVCLVLTASQNRISERQCYIFNGALSLFGKDAMDIIVFFITHSDGLPPKDVLESVEKEKIPCCHDAENQPVHFLFNNRQFQKHTAKNKRAVKMDWEMGEKSLEEFFEFLKSSERKSLTMTVDVLQERKQLEACVQSWQECIEFIEVKQRELTEVQNALIQNKEQIEKDINHLFTVRRVYKEKVDITDASWWDEKATSCDVCKKNCHEFGCWRSPTVWWCEIISDNKCKVCGCHYTTHTREAKKYVTKEKSETVTFEELKNKYINTNAENITYDKSAFNTVKTEHEKKLKRKEELMNQESSLTELLAKKEKEKNSSVKEAYEAIIKLSEIALKPDSAFTLQYLEFLIPRVEEAGEAEWAQKLKDLQKDAAKESTTYAVGYLNSMKGFFSGKGFVSKQ
uniref:AAA+ ATPase domain-containing protein n=1 Tax=Astyanax mexicanus TaxID=7994 RepID=A0A3B1IG82_ASTMX